MERFNEAIEHRKAGRDQDALAALDSLLADKPKFVAGLMLRAEIRMSRGLLDEAARDLDVVFETPEPTTDGGDVALAFTASEAARRHLLRAELHDKRGDPASARADLDSADRRLDVKMDGGPPWLREQLQGMRARVQGARIALDRGEPLGGPLPAQAERTPVDPDDDSWEPVR